MCSDPDSVAWQIITCGVSTNIAGVCLKKPSSSWCEETHVPPSSPFLETEARGQACPQLCFPEAPCSSDPPPVFGVQVWVLDHLPHLAACEHHCLPGSGAAAVAPDGRDRVFLQETQNQIKNSQASTFPVTD